MLIIAKTFSVMVVDGQILRQKAIDQWTRDLPVKAKRGDIVDCNGKILAGSKGTYSVFIRTRCVTNPAQVADVLSNILNVDYKWLYDSIVAKNRSEITVKSEVDGNVIDSIRSFTLNGVYFSVDNSRVYPYNQALCQTLGYISSDGNGQTGLEKYYDSYLRGEDGEILYESDLTGNDVQGKSPHYQPATDGMSIRLTIDSDIQLICEGELQKAMEQYTPKSAQVIVMQPSSGRVLAMCQYPSYDLNDLPREDTERLLKEGRNSLITDSYEPGSTFKVITACANVEEYLKNNPKAYSPDYVFPSSRYRVVGGRKIKCWTTHANGKHANENLALALNNSCNPIFVDIALSLGKNTFYEYVEKFNFGKVTGIDFNGEATGMLVPQSAVTEGDLARIGFGQTIAVTPIQLASSICAAVNGGVYYKPYLVEEIYTDEKTVYKNYGVETGRVISEQASKTVAGYLKNVVSEGSGKQAYIEGYNVGGKTGTAQKYQNGVISAGKYVMSFVGFFPAENPQYLALVIVDEPIGGQYGSTVAAPICKNIFQSIINTKKVKQSV